MRLPALPALPARSTDEPACNPPQRRISRRRWFMWTAGLLCIPVVIQQAQRVRRRLRGEPGPTGWFGHC